MKRSGVGLLMAAALVDGGGTVDAVDDFFEYGTVSDVIRVTVTPGSP